MRHGKYDTVIVVDVARAPGRAEHPGSVDHSPVLVEHDPARRLDHEPDRDRLRRVVLDLDDHDRAAGRAVGVAHGIHALDRVAMSDAQRRMDDRGGIRT